MQITLQDHLGLDCGLTVNCMSSVKAGRREDPSLKLEGTLSPLSLY